MLKQGNVVSLKNSIYIVKDSVYEDNKLQQICLLHIDASNCETIVSRKYPFKKKVFRQECIDGECDCYDGIINECPFDEVIDEDSHIDNVKFVANNIKEHITRRLTSNLFTK